MTLTMHAAEDLVAGVQGGRSAAATPVITQLFDCIDLVARWVDAFDAHGELPPGAGQDARAMAEQLRARLDAAGNRPVGSRSAISRNGRPGCSTTGARTWQSASAHAGQGCLRCPMSRTPDVFLTATTRFNCCGKFQACLRCKSKAQPSISLWPTSTRFSCSFKFFAIAEGPRDRLDSIFRSVPDQVRIIDLPVDAFASQPTELGGVRMTRIVRAVIGEQSEMLRASAQAEGLAGRIGAAARSASNALHHANRGVVAQLIVEVAIRMYSRLAYVYWFSAGKIPCAWAHLREMNLAERYPPTPELAQAYSEHAPVMTMAPWYSPRPRLRPAVLRDPPRPGRRVGPGPVPELPRRRALRRVPLPGVHRAVPRGGPAARAHRRPVGAEHRARGPWSSATTASASSTAAVDLARRLYATRPRPSATAPRRASSSAVGPGPRRAGSPPSSSTPSWAATPATPRPPSEVQLADGLRLPLRRRPRRCGGAARPRPTPSSGDAGLRQEYVAPVKPWLATALRMQLEATDAHATGRLRARRLRRAARTARQADRLSRSYRNNRPHALRERALVADLRGRRGGPDRLPGPQPGGGRGAGRGLRGRAHPSGRRPPGRGDGAAGASPRPRWPTPRRTSGRSRSVERGGRADARRTRRRATRCPWPTASSLLLAVGPTDRRGGVPGRRLRGRARGGAPAAAGRSTATSSRSATTSADAAHHRVGRERARAQPRARSPGRSRPRTRWSAGPSDDADSSESLLLAGLRSVLCAPIVCDGAVVACFYVTHHEVNDLFGEIEVQLAEFIATLAGAALEHVAGSEARFRSLVQNSSDVITIVGHRRPDHLPELLDRAGLRLRAPRGHGPAPAGLAAPRRSRPPCWPSSTSPSLRRRGREPGRDPHAAPRRHLPRRRDDDHEHARRPRRPGPRAQHAAT